MENILICIQTPIISVSDLISIANTAILIITLWVMKRGYEENTRLNRLQQAENTIVKQIEFHNNLMKGISIDYASTGRGFGYPNAPTNAYGQDAFGLLYEILKENYSTMPGNTYKNEFDIDAEENGLRIHLLNYTKFMVA